MTAPMAHTQPSTPRHPAPLISMPVGDGTVWPDGQRRPPTNPEPSAGVGGWANLAVRPKRAPADRRKAPAP